MYLYYYSFFYFARHFYNLFRKKKFICQCERTTLATTFYYKYNKIASAVDVGPQDSTKNIVLYIMQKRLEFIS